MVATLDELLQVPGVAAACEFTADGTLSTFKAHQQDVPRELAEATVQFAGSVAQLFAALAETYAPLSQLRWAPAGGWLYAGGDWSVAVGGNKVVFAATAQTDFTQLAAALFASE